jgi:hypothetical protein
MLVFGNVAEDGRGVAEIDEKKMAKRRDNRIRGERLNFIYSSLIELSLHF